MFMIKRITDKRMAGRICGSYGIEEPGAIVYGAFKDDDVLATAIFLTEGDTLVLEDIDMGRRLDVDLADGIARAAFSAAQRQDVKRARLGEKLPQELRLGLTKRGYDMKEAFSLKAFFSKKRCGK